jgi:rhodanese-related sulfurtransferase
VREKIEFHTFNLGGLNIPLGQLAGVLEDDDLDFDAQKPIIVVCQHGLRSKTAKLLLQSAGFKQAQNLLGGLVKLQRIS